MIKRRPRFLCDVDGVLADFVTPALKVVERVTGRPAPADAHEDWDLFRSYPEEVQEVFFREFKRKGWCLSLPVYCEALDGIRHILEIADVYFVTSPMNGPYWTHEREQWLAGHFGVNRNRIVHTNAKYLCVGDVFLDDKPEHVIEWSAHHPEACAVLWDQPYNRKHMQLRRADCWDRVVELVCEVGAS